MKINAKGLLYNELNEMLREKPGNCVIDNCLGQRFIGAGQSDRKIVIHGTPGNALGAYMNGATIEVFGNAQDAVGDTMNEGRIIIHGNIGDTAGYAMRGGEIYVQGNAGYRAGVHMKAYKEKFPVVVIGGCAGSFLGEYQAGGLIIVLGLHENHRKIVNNFPCTGMHGGKLFVRSDCRDVLFPEQVQVHAADDTDRKRIKKYVENYCRFFGRSDAKELLASDYTVVVPDSNNPYKQMYVAN